MAAGGDQLVVRAQLDDPTSRHDRDRVAAPGLGKAVGHDDGGPARRHGVRGAFQGAGTRAARLRRRLARCS